MNVKYTKDEKEASDVVRENYDYFLDNKDTISSKHKHQFVLIYNKEFIGFFDKEEDAIKEGVKAYGSYNFSVQAVDDQPIDLGILSYGTP